MHDRGRWFFRFLFFFLSLVDHPVDLALGHSSVLRADFHRVHPRLSLVDVMLYMLFHRHIAPEGVFRGFQLALTVDYEYILPSRLAFAVESHGAAQSGAGYLLVQLRELAAQRYLPIAESGEQVVERSAQLVRSLGEASRAAPSAPRGSSREIPRTRTSP